MAGFEFRFSGPIAKKYGTNEAVILYNFAFWIKQNTANQRNVRDGRVWTYNSHRALSEIFDFLSERQIRHILKKLEEAGAIIKGNYNAKKMDHTCWYSISDEVMEYYGIEPPPVGMESEEMDRPSKFVKPKRQICQIEATDLSDGSAKSVAAIPDNKPDNKPDNTLSGEFADKVQAEQFELFWTMYPRKDKRKETIRVWKRLKPDRALFQRIMTALDLFRASSQWKDVRGKWRKEYIPLPTSWLNAERWNDESVRPARNAPDGPGRPERIEPGEGYRYV